MNTSTGAGYDISAACIFFTDDTININDLKMQIHAVLEMFSSHFNLIIQR
jgi:hypothetical protein